MQDKQNNIKMVNIQDIKTDLKNICTKREMVPDVLDYRHQQKNLEQKISLLDYYKVLIKIFQIKWKLILYIN